MSLGLRSRCKRPFKLTPAVHRIRVIDPEVALTRLKLKALKSTMTSATAELSAVESVQVFSRPLHEVHFNARPQA
jgi:hypothetical protein